MNIDPLFNSHAWDLMPKEAIALQKQLSTQVIRNSTLNIDDIVTVTGIDTHYLKGISLAAAVTIRLTDMETVEYSTAVKRVCFPYIPGLLTFREGPVILDALNKLTTTPEVLIFDGQGIAHPRRCGLASHIGLLLDRPSVGCAKTLLSGSYDNPKNDKGSFSLIKDGDETIGAVVRTRSGIKPLFVSIGHHINLHDSIKIVLKCCHRYRLPESIRRADKLARSKLIG